MMKMSNFSDWVEHHVDARWADEADQVEWIALKNGSCSFEGGKMDDEVSGQMIDYQSAKESDAEDIAIIGESQEEVITRKLSDRSNEALKEERRREELAAGVRREIERRA